MNVYQKNAIAYLKAQINIARKARAENNTSTFETIHSMMRSELSYCMIIGLFSIEKKNLLLKITENMIHAENSR